MAYLLDTSICSQPLKRQPHLGVLERWDGLLNGEAFTARVCLAEIEWGLHKLGNARLWSGYRRDVLPSLRVVATGSGVWQEWSRMKARQEASGRWVDDLDLLIAASASWQGLTLATLNARHFSLIEGLNWEDWSG